MVELPFQPRAGQVWREVDDPRHSYVRIEKIEPANIATRSVLRTLEGWRSVRGSTLSHVHPKRFNGEHGGYAFVETDPKFLDEECK
jgi:hypothetical protein